MSFNSENPWGGKDPEEIINSLKEKFNFKLPKNKFVPILIALAFLLLFSWPYRTALWPFYTIETDEVGIVLRFGKFIEATEPGLHFKLPLGIEKVIPVKVERNYQEEFGFRTKSAGVRTTYSQKSYDNESMMLTGDLNVMDIEWIVQFKIRDPFSTLFKVRDVTKTLRDVSESIMREVVGDYSFNEVLRNRLEIGDKVRGKMQTILDEYTTGLQIITVKLQDVNPPQTVKPAFNEVNQAKQEKKKMKNQADEVYYRKIPEAKGTALKMVQEAEGYAQERVNVALGDAKRFTLLWEAYSKSKNVTRRRIYLEYMDDVFRKTGKKYILDPDQKGIIPLLRLGNEK